MLCHPLYRRTNLVFSFFQQSTFGTSKLWWGGSGHYGRGGGLPTLWRSGSRKNSIKPKVGTIRKTKFFWPIMGGGQTLTLGTMTGSASLRQVLTTAVELPLLFFHCCMLIFLLAQMRKKVASYRQGFYVLYSAVSATDVAYIIIVGLELKPACRIF